MGKEKLTECSCGHDPELMRGISPGKPDIWQVVCQFCRKDAGMYTTKSSAIAMWESISKPSNTTAKDGM